MSQFFHFHDIQLFCANTKMYRNFNFSFIFAHENMKKYSLKSRIHKITVIFSTTQTTRSVQRQQKYKILVFIVTTPARTHPISGLKSRVCEIEMMVKNWSRIFIQKFSKPLQSCCCPVQEICPKRLNWPSSLAGISEGAR